MGSLFGGQPSPVAPDESAKSADMYICVNASTVELVDLVLSSDLSNLNSEHSVGRRDQE